jgi:hypothetical protein
MNPAFFTKIEEILHTERIDVYRKDGADPVVTLARYLLNMALGGALYSTLQFAEIALRNSIHKALTIRCATDVWYGSPRSRLTPWQRDRVTEALGSLSKRNKPHTPGRIVAELTFGFWTSFFNKAHARTGIGACLAKNAFPHAPATEQYLAKLDRRWKEIRDLRNRVFHHERILHWRDLDARHHAILEIISWISPQLHDLAKTLDRFPALRASGLNPWLHRLSCHWPGSAPTPVFTSDVLAIVDGPVDASDGIPTPFGRRWGGQIVTLSPTHIQTLRTGQTLALDVRSEYIVYLNAEVDQGGIG